MTDLDTAARRLATAVEGRDDAALAEALTALTAAGGPWLLGRLAAHAMTGLASAVEAAAAAPAPMTPPPAAAPGHDVGEVHWRVSDVAKRLGVSPSSVYDRINDGQLEAVDIGTDTTKRLRVPERSLLRYLKGRTLPARS